MRGVGWNQHPPTNPLYTFPKFSLKNQQPRQIERSIFFYLLDHKGQTRVYTLVSGQPDVWLMRNCNFLIEDNDLKKCLLKLRRTATMRPKQIECSVFPNWTTADKPEFTDCGENEIFQQRMMIAPSYSTEVLSM